MKTKTKIRQKSFRIGKIPICLFMVGIFLLPQLAWLSPISEEKIIELTNEERAKKDLPALTANQLLAKAAFEKAEAIMQKGLFQHTIDDRAFSAWIKDSGYRYSFIGENLAINFLTSEGVLRAWMDSESHRNNLLNEKFTEIGVAVKEGVFEGKNSLLVVQVFGKPLPGNPDADALPAMDSEAKSTEKTLAENSANFPSSKVKIAINPVVGKSILNELTFWQNLKSLIDKGGKINLLALNYLIFLSLIAAVLALATKIYYQEKHLQ